MMQCVILYDVMLILKNDKNDNDMVAAAAYEVAGANQLSHLLPLNPHTPHPGEFSLRHDILVTV